MFKHQMMERFAGVAALSLVALAGTAIPARAQAPAAGAPAAHQKTYKQGEYDLYNAALKDFAAKNWAKTVSDLDAWKQKIPTSDYADERSVIYVQAYGELKQYDKVLAEAAGLLSKDLDATFPDPKTGPGQVLPVLLGSAVAIQNLPNPNPEQMATAEKAARQLDQYNRKPEGVPQAAWDDARKQLHAAAQGALIYIAVIPGAQALQKNDCATAQSVYSKALGDYPDKSFISYQLAQSYMCAIKADPAKNDEVRPKAIYEFVRTLVIDPSLGGSQDAKKMGDMLTNTYVNYHGGNDGLDALKEQAKATPLPPADFTIESATKVAERKQKEFAEKYPQLALWMGIKGQLAGANGQQYFDSQLKNAAVPKLKGTLLEGKPACRPKELLISVPEPNQQGTAQAEITLKLDSPVGGKPEAGEIQWEGVPSAFTPDPFMLTMDTEKAKIDGLKTTPCTPAGVRPGVRKAAPRKK